MGLNIEEYEGLVEAPDFFTQISLAKVCKIENTEKQILSLFPLNSAYDFTLIFIGSLKVTAAASLILEMSQIMMRYDSIFI